MSSWLGGEIKIKTTTFAVTFVAFATLLSADTAFSQVRRQRTYDDCAVCPEGRDYRRGARWPRGYGGTEKVMDAAAKWFGRAGPHLGGGGFSMLMHTAVLVTDPFKAIAVR